jgi:hypothetical protein
MFPSHYTILSNTNTLNKMWLNLSQLHKEEIDVDYNFYKKNLQ